VINFLNMIIQNTNTLYSFIVISVWKTFHTKQHVQMAFLMMNTCCSKHAEDAKNWIKTLISKVCICLLRYISKDCPSTLAVNWADWTVSYSGHLNSWYPTKRQFSTKEWRREWWHTDEMPSPIFRVMWLE